MSETRPDPADPRHPIKVVARRTGLTPDVLRVWEKRYRAVLPTRVDAGRRLYSDADVERLLLLRRATLAGRRIGQVAKMPNAELEPLVVDDETAMVVAPRANEAPASRSRTTSPHLDACMNAVLRLDATALESAVWGAAVSLPTPALLEHVVTPLLHTIGEQWRVGTARVANEHLATAVTRSLLSRLRLSTDDGNGGPEIVVTTPSGQLHEMGALMAAITAASEGWRVTYLGRKGRLTQVLRGLRDLPEEERRTTGSSANELKQKLEAAHTQRRTHLDEAHVSRVVESERLA